MLYHPAVQRNEVKERPPARRPWFRKDCRMVWRVTPLSTASDPMRPLPIPIRLQLRFLAGPRRIGSAALFHLLQPLAQLVGAPAVPQCSLCANELRVYPAIII